MRLLLIAIICSFSAQAQAQTGLPLNYMDYAQRYPLASHNYFSDSTPNKKWSVSKYIGLTTSYGFFNGGSATMLSVPIGLQLNRTLNKNWIAFAGVSVAPVYINFNHAFVSSTNNKFGQGNGFTGNHLDMYSRAELGLMYINDAKTFSISGSIGIERSSNNYILAPQNQASLSRQNAIISQKR